MLRRWGRRRSGKVSDSPRRGGQKIPRLRIEPLEARDVPSAALVGVNSDGTAQANQPVTFLGASGDGRYVIFSSAATNLVAGQVDAANTLDLFWRDTQLGVTRLVTAKAGSGGLEALGDFAEEAAISFDGLSVVFGSPTNAEVIDATVPAGKDTAGVDFFRWNLAAPDAETPTVRVVTAKATGEMIGTTAEVRNPVLSDDGRFVGFLSDIPAGEVEAGVTNDAADTFDIFRRDMTVTDFATATATVTLKNGVTTDAVGNVAGVSVVPRRYMTGDGRFFAFSTKADASAAIDATLADAADTEDVFLRDMDVAAGGAAVKAVSTVAASATTLVGASAGAPISTGAVIARTGDTVVFVSNAPGGTPADSLVGGFVNGNGDGFDLYVRPSAFTSSLTQLVTAQAGSTNRGGVGHAGNFGISGDGKVIGFEYSSFDLTGAVTDVNGVSDVFAYDIATAEITPVSVTKGGTFTGTQQSKFFGISEDGRFVGFNSATEANAFQNFVSDPNGQDLDVFVRDLAEGRTTVVSTVPGGSRTGNAFSNGLALAGEAAGGGKVYFASTATDLLGDFVTAGSNLFVTAVPPGGFPPPDPGLGRLAVNGGTNGAVNVYAFGADGKVDFRSTFNPFPGFTGEIRTATGDVDGDGVADTVVGAGEGGSPHVKVISGASGAEVRSFFAFEVSFTGGLFVATGDYDGDGFADIVVSPDDGGGPRVRVLSGKTGATLADFLGIEDPNFRGGARVGVGDVDGDGVPDLVVGAGFGGGPRVAVFDGSALLSAAPGELPPKLFGDFFMFENTLRNGAFVAAGDLNGDGFAEVIGGGGPGGGPRIFALDGKGLLDSGGVTQTPVANFFAGEPTTQGGVRVVAKDIDGDALADLVTGLGPGGPATVTTYTGAAIAAAGPEATPEALESFTPFAGLTGVNVG